MRVGLLRQVFWDVDGEAALAASLHEARTAGAELVLLPELPLNPWSPADREVRATDAEPPLGPRHQRQSRAARDAGVGLLGGAILVDPDTGARHNTALLFDAAGELRHAYRKVHVPQEPGFWEQDHYTAGDEPPSRIEGFPMPLGVQICSDVNRPQGCHILGALGAEAILVPRATEAATFERWQLVFRANALTSCCYVLSVSRPGPENGVGLGGPSVVVAPDGEVIMQTEDRLAVVELHRDLVVRARDQYPGYLAIPDALYEQGWRRVREP